MNLLVIPTLTIALLLFPIGRNSIRNCKSRSSVFLTLIFWVFLGIPGFLFPLYYMHWFDEFKWYYEFRSIPYIELTAAGTGLLAGALSELFKNCKLRIKSYLIIILCIGIILPHLKPVVAPLADAKFSNQWKDDVCLQSTPSSCGAACVATIFRSFEIDISEKEIAHECHTYLGGTENWYIARAFRKRGFKVSYRIGHEFPEKLNLPAIAGVRIGNAGHFITILSQSNSIYCIGDPLSGKLQIPANQIAGTFKFTGFFMEIERNSSD